MERRDVPMERSLLMALRIIHRLLEIDVDQVFLNSPNYGKVYVPRTALKCLFSCCGGC